jgi:hypothetical protein
MVDGSSRVAATVPHTTIIIEGILMKSPSPLPINIVAMINPIPETTPIMVAISIITFSSYLSYG